MKRRLVRTVVLFFTALAGCSLHAQTSPDSNPGEQRVAEYCQALAGGGKQADALKSACQYALTIQKALPNYICDEKVTRWNMAERLQDVIDAQVTVINGEDSYSNIRINGKRTPMKLSELPGIWSSGEFGMLVPLLFAPENRARFEFRKEELLNSRPALLFSFTVSERENKSFFVWDLNGWKWSPGYKGSLWLDKGTLRAVRLKMVSTRVKMQYAGVDTEYGDVQLMDGTTFLLPLRSSLKSCTDDNRGLRVTCARNYLEYTNCHKFRARTKIVTGE